MVFTKRDKTAPAIKALSAEFRDRLRISIIHVPDNKPSEYSKVLLKDYEVTDLPKMVVEQTYDPKEDKLLSQYGIHDYKHKEFKIHQLIEFLEPFARKEVKEESEDIQENREQQNSDSVDGSPGKQNFIEMSDATFKKNILSSTESQMVYFTTLSKDTDV